ncbi:hypothetical protein JX265_006962 [Neoarthrinium moseri]|uniref:Tyrosinase copper-binding domain-containing protein n=1 Tax=Neoarthrinium moseri TaxID=1658444 RepID=A0A9P9WLG7_9PEZI|nr:uncharacterized protein JN550_010192 [Neoarthrinium moseri]KAI1862667.1 hypothetical protein JN550_010192 [Neoarthrinium moseri]KAI1868983.1 hypothetical protein JX265_006962 [Neoarthrinium moseri]
MRWATAALAAAITGKTVAGNECTQPAVRREWRVLAEQEKVDYIAAVKCLTTKPSKVGLATSLYEDFPWIHSQLNSNIHFVASFLPWHRWFVHLYESELRGQCNYRGTMPYWDWTQDSGALPSAPVFLESTTSGFGAGGLQNEFQSPTRPNPLTSCVTTGAFANLSLTYYTTTERTHCLNRSFNNGTGSSPTDDSWQAALYSPAMIANITDKSPSFEKFWVELENNPHGAIHNSIGGDMVPSTSPNDPLFFLHHSQVDRLWWIWQQKDPMTRNSDYSGNKYPYDDETPASLADTMTFGGLSTNITVADVMSTIRGGLCYGYA